jgi:hypothetical protein
MMSESTVNRENKPGQKKQGLSSHFIEKAAAEFQLIRASKRKPE